MGICVSQNIQTMTEEEKKKALENFNALMEDARKNNVNMTMDEINEEIRLARAERKQREKEKAERKYCPAFLIDCISIIIYTLLYCVSPTHA